MLAQEIIRKKRDGRSLDHRDIEQFVRGLVDGSWSEGQCAAMAMAMFLKGMSSAETIALTQSMTHSGQVMDWAGSALPGPILDKHSSGGVGDKVSLMLAPIVAACGGFVPMVSGRGLGHTGGTLDKFDCIPGYQTAPDTQRLRLALQSAGCAVIGQTAELAPADRRLYAIRDVTATVESVALITASILSKKLAAGLQGLVMDVKVGNGAFAATQEMALELANSLVTVANGAGLPTRAWITDMNQVLGETCGNALEMLEAVEFLSGQRREPRLLEVTRMLCAEMLLLGKLAPDQEQALRQVDQALASGAALERFSRMVRALGGPGDFAQYPDRYLPPAPVQLPVKARQSGWIGAMQTRDIGLLVIGLGGGRRKATDAIDARVGYSQMMALGTAVKAGQTLALVHAADAESASAAERGLLGCIEIVAQPPALAPIMKTRIAL
jgi:thymidine phosphorylase